MAIIKKTTEYKCWWRCGEKGTLVHCWWDMNWYSHYGKLWRVLQKLQIEWPYNLAIPFLDIFPKKTKTLIEKDRYTPLFIATLFIITKIWKQPKCCPFVDKWIKRSLSLSLFHTHTHTHTHSTLEYYLDIKGTKLCHFQHPGGYCAKWNRSETER